MWSLRRAAAVSAVLAVLPVVLFVLGTMLSDTSGTVAGFDQPGLAGILTRLSVPALMLSPPALLVVLGWLIAEIVNGLRS